MKKSLIIPALALFSLASCKNKTGKNSIVGTWKLTELNLKNVNDEGKKKMIDSVRIEWTADGRFISTTPDKNVTGTYSYNEKGHTLTATNTSGAENKTQLFTIEWENDKLVMTNEDGVVKLKRE